MTNEQRKIMIQYRKDNPSCKTCAFSGYDFMSIIERCCLLSNKKILFDRGNRCKYYQPQEE